jgi:hypothetical protein
MNPRFLDLGTTWRRVVSFTLRPLYSHCIGGQAESRPRLNAKENGRLFALPRIKPRPLGRPIARPYTDRATAALVV